MTTAKEAHDIASELLAILTPKQAGGFWLKWNTLLLYLEEKKREEKPE